MKRRGWVASLSNGETIFETAPVPGEISSWQKLLLRLKDEELKITQMRLQRGGSTIVAIPKAKGYAQMYQARVSLNTGIQEHLQGIGSIVGEEVFVCWMNEFGDIWQEVIPLEEVKIHSTMRY